MEQLIAKANNESWNWDDCKYRTPLGLSQEEFWFHIKLARRVEKTSTPLTDRKGNPFHYRLPKEVQRILHLIDLHLGGSIDSPFPAIDSQSDRERYLITSLQEEAISSSLIEGALSTRVQAREMIRSERKPKNRHEQMILNNYRTIRFLNEQRTETLTPELLCHVQRMLTNETLDNPDAAGRFRLANENIHVVDEENQEILHTPPPAELLPVRIRKLCDFANQKTDLSNVGDFIHPAVRAIILHFWLAYDHPFVDGNGRTARALFYWSMLRQGYWLTEYLSISSIIAGQVKQYGRAYLDTEIDENDLTYFLTYHFHVIERSLKEFRKYVDQKKAEQARMTSLLPGQWNSRQKALLSRALKDPTAVFSYESHANSHGIALMTARNDLLELKKRGLLIQNKEGKRFVFSPAPNIDAVIEKLSSKRVSKKRM